MADDAPAPGGAGAAAARRRLLVVGSSLAAGCNAEPLTQGWAHHLARALEARGVDTVNEAVPGSNVVYWTKFFGEKDWVDRAAELDIVILSLSLGNEGLSSCATQDECDRLAAGYTRGLLEIARTVRGQLRPGARLVLGGPYPNLGYREEHLKAVQGVRDAIASWEEVDYVIDFLRRPLLESGTGGRWGDGLASDPGHPNTEGHRCMFELVDQERVLGTS
mmetsp:Transcript_54156/g.164593  ORF Transcript_54156/g.164593 Transcript_54156/m.164593 type:complete len:220 (-) Transcript_54156:46-705(-)